MRRTAAIIVGGGQAGLAMSRCLSDRGIDHVVLERGRLAERWRSERWDSLRLLTPNWQSRLPGFRYDGPDPDGYMTMAEVVSFLERYAAAGRAPVETQTTVQAVDVAAGGWRVTTDRGEWTASAVVLATGYCDRPFVPGLAARVPASIAQIVPTRYRRPSLLPPGGVLVVGASASGVQIAGELLESGRRVVIAAGRHLRVPRVYRGRDILWWLDRMGLLDATEDDVHDVGISREQPSLQLIGHPDRHSLDLARLRQRGAQVVGRLVDVDGPRVRFDDDLVATAAASDVKLGLLLARIDAFAQQTRMDRDLPPAEPFEPTWPLFTDSTGAIDLGRDGIGSIVWATGFRRSYPWLRVAVLDEQGEIRHRHGVTPWPGLFVLGMPFQRTRKSAFIDGVGNDAAWLSARVDEHLHGQLAAIAVAPVRGASDGYRASRT